MADSTQMIFDLNVAASDAADAVAKYSRLTASEAYCFIATYLRALADKHAPLEMDEARPVEMEGGFEGDNHSHSPNIYS